MDPLWLSEGCLKEDLCKNVNWIKMAPGIFKWRVLVCKIQMNIWIALTLGHFFIISLQSFVISGCNSNCVAPELCTRDKLFFAFNYPFKVTNLSNPVAYRAYIRPDFSREIRIFVIWPRYPDRVAIGR